ncbi:(2Fe-2S)-binding protein [bacterium]|nr:(2Fe-2S)-binding protein [bacterium]
MSDEKTITFTIDDAEVTGRPGQTILEAADEAGIYIPRLCAMKGLSPYGACRICTCMVNGRPQTACTFPIAEGMVVENETPELKEIRVSIVEMLFVEGNHFCMFCEASGKCELQALGYRLGMLAPKYPYQFPKREVDATHPDVMVDHNRCILCARCIRASDELDGKNVFGFINRGSEKKVGVSSGDGLCETRISAEDKAAEACPVGAILKKRTGYLVPIGERLYDWEPIGSDIEKTAIKP